MTSERWDWTSILKILQEEPLHGHALYKILCYLVGMGSHWWILSRKMITLDVNIRSFWQQWGGGPQEDSAEVVVWWLVSSGSPVRARRIWTKTATTKMDTMGIKIEYEGWVCKEGAEEIDIILNKSQVCVWVENSDV